MCKAAFGGRARSRDRPDYHPSLQGRGPARLQRDHAKRAAPEKPLSPLTALPLPRRHEGYRKLMQAGPLLIQEGRKIVFEVLTPEEGKGLKRVNPNSKHPRFRETHLERH